MKQISFSFNETPHSSSQSEEKHIYSISELNNLTSETLTHQIPPLWVQGEISNFKAHTSGHYYFSLKDKKAQINAIMFKGNNSKLKFRPSNGMKVLVQGRITLYEPQGRLQIMCTHMEPHGVGSLHQALEQLKNKLKTEGLFERKRPLPSFPQNVAVITSVKGAAIRDILNVLKRRNKSLPVTIIPSLVQGPSAVPHLLEAIKKAKQLDPEILILARGGGSIEDLWCFNDEKVARSLAQMKSLLISAVGHETDFTICDFICDQRASTPSAAAEIVTP